MSSGAGGSTAAAYKITSAAGVPKGSFYSHSARKQELAAEIVGRYNHATDVGILKAGSESAVRRLRSHFHAQAAQTEQSGMEFGCLLGTLGAESPAAGENVRAKVAASLDIRTDAVAAAVEEAQSTRKVAPNRPAQELAAYLIDSFEGATLRAKVARDGAALVRFFDVTFKTVLA